MGGLNTVAAGLTMPMTDCVSVWNLIPSEAGLRNRLGYREWCTGVTGSADNKVRALLSFAGSEPSQNRLFATTDVGIYSVTNTGAPTLDYEFPVFTDIAGYGTGRVVVTSGGHYYVYCDEEHGLHVYAETGATWTAPAMGVGAGEIANVDPADLVHATVFKKRVWFTERDSTSAWYLAAGAIFGAATEFDFGTHFSMGGHLVGLYNWTYDGGAGIDDSLVAVSSTGDVVVINGVDPDDPTSFNVRGVWNMGPPPAGRDIAKEVNGDVYLLSSLGVRTLSSLVVGAEERSFVTMKISNLFNQLMLTRSEERGWSMHLHPEDNALLVLYPDYSTETSRQLALSQPTKGWFHYRDVPMHCAVVWNGRLHFGTQDGRVCVSRDYLDNVSLDGLTYDEIRWDLLTSFQRAGGGNQVSVNQIRALFTIDGSNPDISMAARYGYDMSELPTPTPSAATSGTWDNGLWDVAVWGGGSASVTFRRGATGSGHEVAVGIRGTALARTTLVQLEAAFEVGGWL
jgi:hypothetical protein